MTEINHIVVQDLGLVIYRVFLPDGTTREFDDLEQAIACAGEHDATGFQLLFPDGTTSTVGRVYQLRDGERSHVIRHFSTELALISSHCPRLPRRSTPAQQAERASR